jgi:hypothetical protein
MEMWSVFVVSQECPEDDSREHGNRNWKGIKRHKWSDWLFLKNDCSLYIGGLLLGSMSDFVKRAMNFQAVQGQGVS